MRSLLFMVSFLYLLDIGASTVGATDGADQPARIAVGRWALKKTLEDYKSAKPRLPLPPLTDEEKQRPRPPVSQNRMRRLLDPEIRPTWPRDWLDSNMPLTRLMRNQLLWVTSRVNNCLY
jgi:hypothetical protein